eukprot:762397-Rhodomonas_salina.1
MYPDRKIPLHAYSRRSLTRSEPESSLAKHLQPGDRDGFRLAPGPATVGPRRRAQAGPGLGGLQVEAASGSANAAGCQCPSR